MLLLFYFWKISHYAKRGVKRIFIPKSQQLLGLTSKISMKKRAAYLVMSSTKSLFVFM